jgi:homeobox-leucine zipper protein
MSPSCSTSHDQENIKSSLEFYTGIFGLDESRILDVVNQAMDELIKMATMDEPLWLRSLETGREILNYDEYMKEFVVENSDNGRPKRSIEASRDTGVVFADLPRIVQCFLDAVRHNLMLIYTLNYVLQDFNHINNIIISIKFLLVFLFSLTF